MPEGGYELISGHRRLAACQVLGIETMPVIIREMSDDEAVIAMVDANLQREHILPSEKAFAYKMKLDAIKHQGVTSRQVGEKLLSVTQVSKESDDSERQIQRYIRLTYLIPELLSMVDEGKIAFNPAVEISYLDKAEQRVLLNAMELNDCTPSHAQSIRLKKLSQEGVLQDRTIYDILAEQKPNQQEQYKFKREDIRKYFPKSYTDKQVCDTVIKLLEQCSAGGSVTGTAADSNRKCVRSTTFAQWKERHRQGTMALSVPTVRECQIQRTEVKQIWYQDIYRSKRDTTTPC